jgi:protein subunit release factor B
MNAQDEKWNKLLRRMQKLGIHEDDLTEKFIRGSGKGGQKINTTSSCVYLKHSPSNIEIKCQDSRSQEKNRFTARERLCQIIDAINEKERLQKRQEIEKKRQASRKRSPSAQRKVSKEKQHRSKLKESRRPPKGDD